MKHYLLNPTASAPDALHSCDDCGRVVRHKRRFEIGSAFAVAKASPDSLVKLVRPELGPASLPDRCGEQGMGSRINKSVESANAALQRSLKWLETAWHATFDLLCAVTGLTGAICRHRHKGHHSLHQIEYGGGYVRVCNLCQHACCVKR